MIKKNLSRRERFEKVAARRVQKVLEFLDSLANCSNKGNYEYTEDDIKKMFRTIREQLNITEAAFEKQIHKMQKKNFKF